MVPSPILLLALLASTGATPARDPNAAATRRPIDLRVLNNDIDRPLTGLWLLEIPELPARKIEIKPPEAGPPNSLVGVDTTTQDVILRLTHKKEGLGYEGQLERALASCGIDTLGISEFLPIGSAAVLRFQTGPTGAPCPPIDGGRAGRFVVVSRNGAPVRLRDFGEISSSGVRETYSIGGDRPNVERSYDIPLGGVRLDDGTEVRFLQRVKAPLDGAYWFQVEAVMPSDATSAPPKGYLPADQIRFIGALTLKRIP